MEGVTTIEEHKLATDEQILGLTQEEFAKLAQTICVVVLNRGDIKPDLGGCFPQWKVWGTEVFAPEDRFGGFVELTRAGVVRQFIHLAQEKPQLDKLVMMDGDEVVNWEAPYRLAMWDLPVVSGVVCNYTNRRGIWACFTVKDQYGVPRFPSVRFSNLPTRGLVKAHSVGTGLLCIKKNVIEGLYEAGLHPFEIDQKTKDHAFATGVLKHGEDMAFSRQCEKLGYDRYVDLSVHATHWKTIGLVWPLNKFDEEMDPRDFKIDVREYHHGF